MNGTGIVFPMFFYVFLAYLSFNKLREETNCI